VRRQVHVVLRVAQIARYRQAEAGDETGELVGGARAWIDPHADQAHRVLEAACLREARAQIGEEAAGCDRIEHRRLQRDDDAIGHAHDVGEAAPLDLRGRIEHDVRDAARRARHAVVDLPGADRRGLRRAQLQPMTRGLLRIEVAQHGRASVGCEIAGQVRGERRLSDASLRIDDGNDGHARASLRVFRAARRAPGRW